MAPIARIVGGAAAAALLGLLGCDYYPPPQDASSSAAPTSVAAPSEVALQEELRQAEANLAAARAQAASRGSGTSSRGVADLDARSAGRQAPTAPLAPSAPFSSEGEDRIECPPGYLAQAAKDTGCACVSTDDETTVAPFQEAPCSTEGHAEAGECIFTCPQAPASEPAAPSP